MSQRIALQLGFLACAWSWGCSRDRDRESVARDTVSLAPLADSSGSQELDDSAHQSRAGARPGRLANRATPSRTDSGRTNPERRWISRPARKRPVRARSEPAVQAYAPAKDSNSAQPSDTRAAGHHGTVATTSPDSSGPRAAGDTAADGRAAVGDSIIPAATPVAAATESAGMTARNALPAGTQIRAILDDSITSLRNSVGQRVSAVVSGDLQAPDGLAVLPSGSVVHLTIDRLAPARTRSAKDGELVLRADSIVAGGHAYRVDAALQPIPHELRGRGVTAGEVEKVGAGAAAGAVVGGVVTGKTKGAVIGGAVGAAGGAVVAAQTASRDVVVAPRTLITLVLRSPVVRAAP
ncbi:MAG: glycine zipper domain-containing protein [Gemmatimonadales bacterium]